MLGLGGAAATAAPAVGSVAAAAASATAATAGLGTAATGAATAAGGLSTAATGATTAAGGLGGAGGLGATIAAAAPFALAAVAIGGAIWGVTKLLQDTKSAGTEAAESFQDFVSKNIAGGAELAAASDQAFDVMTANNFDYAASLEASGSTMSQVMGGLSENWQQGSTAMDIFTQSVGRATGDMEKAPQVALQMMMGFDSMGLSAEQAGAKMLEIAQAAGMSEAELESLRAAVGALTGQTETASGSMTTLAGAETTAANSATTFSGALQGLQSASGSAETRMASLASTVSGTGGDSETAAGNVSNLGAALSALGVDGNAAELSVKTLGESITRLPKEVPIKVKIETEGEIPAMASGGVVSGLAVVNERGSEIAKFPSGRMALMTAPGPALGAFPAGTEIIPHGRSMTLLRQYPQLPRMAAGGVIPSAATGRVNNYYLTITASVIDRQVIKEIDEGLRRLTARRA